MNNSSLARNNNSNEIVELSAAEIMTWYKGNRHLSKIPADQLSTTSFQTLMQLMTPDQRRDAVFTDEEMAIFRGENGGERAVIAHRQRKAYGDHTDPDDLTPTQMQAMADWSGKGRR